MVLPYDAEGGIPKVVANKVAVLVNSKNPKPKTLFLNYNTYALNRKPLTPNPKP
jgi:hypothetical protein